MGNPIGESVKIFFVSQTKSDAPKAAGISDQKSIEPVYRRLRNIQSWPFANSVSNVINALIQFSDSRSHNPFNGVSIS